MATTIPSIHTYQQGEYERLVAQLACEHETWESVQPHDLLPIYDALMRRDCDYLESSDAWDALIYHDDYVPEGESALYILRRILITSHTGQYSVDESNDYDSLAGRLARNVSLYYDEHIRADFERERATLEESGKPWWKRREFENTRRAIRDRAEGEK